jgi:hypothetical protein
MWHVYNLVREGDRVTGTTFRKVAKDSGTGAESERVKIKLTIQVEGVEFDPEGVRNALVFACFAHGCCHHHSLCCSVPSGVQQLVATPAGGAVLRQESMHAVLVQLQQQDTSVLAGQLSCYTG